MAAFVSWFRPFYGVLGLAMSLMLAACQTDGPLTARHLQPLSPKTLALMEQKQMSKEGPMVIRLFKEESELEVWKQDRAGKMALLKTYPICRWSGELGPKIREGDRQAPEGFYNITPAQMNPNSSLYLSFDLGYPNAFDKSYGRTGSHLMVHGDCSSRGCYAMTDEQISEVYALAREAFFGGQKDFQVQAYPFRMTPQNLSRHRSNPNMPFWKNLKEGSDHFEVSRVEPKVNVCEKRYVFNAQSVGASFDPPGKCPSYQIPQEVAFAVAAKNQRDDIKIAELTRAGTPVAPIRMNTDGGMHSVFLAKVKDGLSQDEKDGPKLSLAVPGTIPQHVNPPGSPKPVWAAETVTSSGSGSSEPPRASAKKGGNKPTALPSTSVAFAAPRQESKGVGSQNPMTFFPPTLPGAAPVVPSGSFGGR